MTALKYLVAAHKYYTAQIAVLNILDDCLKANNDKLTQYYIEKGQLYVRMFDISINAYDTCLEKSSIFYDEIGAKNYLETYWRWIKDDCVLRRLTDSIRKKN